MFLAAQRRPLPTGASRPPWTRFFRRAAPCSRRSSPLLRRRRARGPPLGSAAGEVRVPPGPVVQLLRRASLRRHSAARLGCGLGDPWRRRGRPCRRRRAVRWRRLLAPGPPERLAPIPTRLAYGRGARVLGPARLAPARAPLATRPALRRAPGAHSPVPSIDGRRSAWPPLSRRRDRASTGGRPPPPIDGGRRPAIARVPVVGRPTAVRAHAVRFPT